MKHWSLFFLLSLLLHGIILTLLGLLPSPPATLEELQTSIMEVRLVVFPEPPSTESTAVSDSASTKDEAPGQPEVLPEPETVMENEPVAEDPVEPEKAIPALPDPPRVPPEALAEQEPPEPVPDKSMLTPKKKISPPEPKPEPEAKLELKPKLDPKPKLKPKLKPEHEVKPKPQPVPDKKPKTAASFVKSPAAEKSPSQPAKVPGTAENRKTETSGKPVANSPQGPVILEIVPGDILKRVTPRYPMVSRRRGEEGKVVFILTVGKGQVLKLITESSSGHERLDLAAKQAVKAWRFRNDIDGVFRIPVIFQLD